MVIRGVLACDHASKAAFVNDVRNLCCHNRDVKNSYRHTCFQRCAYLADHVDGASEIRAIVVDDHSSVDEKGGVIFVRVVLFNFEVLQALPTKSFESLSTLF